MRSSRSTRACAPPTPRPLPPLRCCEQAEERCSLREGARCRGLASRSVGLVDVGALNGGCRVGDACRWHLEQRLFTAHRPHAHDDLEVLGLAQRAQKTTTLSVWWWHGDSQAACSASAQFVVGRVGWCDGEEMTLRLLTASLATSKGQVGECHEARASLLTVPESSDEKSESNPSLSWRETL
jgi:hypothetical protein